MKLQSIHLHGAAKKFSAEPFEYAVHDMRDVLSVMKSHFEGFAQFIAENPNWNIVLTDKGMTNPRAVHPEFFANPFHDCEEVHLCPAIEGAGIEAGIAAIITAMGASAAVASFIAMVIVNVATAMIIGAVTSMLAPKPGTGGGSERPDEKPSFLYNGPENVTEQGYQVPIVYGTHMTGSVVVSAGISVEQLAITSTQAPAPANGTGSDQPAYPDDLSWQWTGEVAGG